MVVFLVDASFVPDVPTEEAFFEVTAFGDFLVVVGDEVNFAPSVATLVDNVCFFMALEAVPLDFF